MPSSTVCWGIEVGAYAIKALKLEADGDNVKVVDFAVIPHKKPLSTPGTDPNDTIRVGLGELVSRYDVSEGAGGAAVAVSVPGHSAFARFAKLPPVDPKKVPDIVKFEAVQQIPFPLEQVEWDYQTFKNDDSPDIEVGIFAITRERIMERLQQYEDVGITPDCVTLSPVAAFNALAFDLAFTEKTPGTIVLDIGTTSTDLVIAEAGRVWIRTVPIGGHHFTEALVNAFQLSYPKAEKLKKEAESSKHARHIFQAMRPIFGDLAQEVQRSIGYYQSLHKDAKLERLIGLGSTFRLPGLRKYLKQQVGLDVFRLEQFKRLSIDGPRAGELQAGTLNLATAYGLALQGLGMASLEANLMPSVVVREAMWKRKVKWFGVAACIAVAAGMAMFIRPFLDSQAVAAEPQPQVVKDAISEGSRLKSGASDVTGGAVENAEAAAALALLESRDIFAHIVNDVGLMMKHAQDRERSEAPVFTVKALRTQPRSGGGTDQMGGGMGGMGGTGGGDMGMGGEVESRERILIHMTLTTTHRDPARLVIATVDDWLRQNRTRDGVPYEIVPLRTAEVRTVEVQPQTGPGAPGQPEVWRGGQQPGGEPPMGRGRGGMVGGAGAGDGAGEGEVRTPPPGTTGGTRGGQDLGQVLAAIRSMAPLPKPPAAEAGTRLSTVEVRWEAVLLPKQNAEGGGM